jgi:hypothetical protein
MFSNRYSPLSIFYSISYEEKRAAAKKRLKEVVKYSTLGALTGGSVGLCAAGTMAEVLALKTYRSAVCDYDYSNPPLYTCNTIKCEHGMPELKCTSLGPDLTFSPEILEPGFQAGRNAHSVWWDHTGQALVMYMTTTSITLGGILGGIYGFFKKIPTAEEAAAEAERERKHIEENEMVAEMECIIPLNCCPRRST